MEYEEHQIRLKTLRVQHEDAVLRRDMAVGKKLYMEEKHKLELELLRRSVDGPNDLD